MKERSKTNKNEVEKLFFSSEELDQIADDQAADYITRNMTIETIATFPCLKKEARNVTPSISVEYKISAKEGTFLARGTKSTNDCIEI